MIYKADKKRMLELEKESVKLNEKLNKDPNNATLITEARAAERLFHQSMFILKSRNGAAITWVGWKSEYCKEIQPSAYGEEYALTRKYCFCCCKQLFNSNKIILNELNYYYCRIR